MQASLLELQARCASVIAPLVAKDGGTAEVTRADESEVEVVLSAACAGCPGVSLTAEYVVRPALAHLLDGRHLSVVSRVLLPTGQLSQS